MLCIDLPGRAEELVRKHALQHTTPISLDLSDPKVMPAVVDTLIASYGLPDAVAHLAFTSFQEHGLETLPSEDFQAMFGNNVTPTFALCRAIAERMKSRGFGSIVLFASMYGFVSPDPRLYHEPMKPNRIDYGAAKAAILQITRYFAVHYGPLGLRFNSIAPGPFPNPAIRRLNTTFVDRLSDRTALRRIAADSEIVGPTLFLLSSDSSYITGHCLVVDGGWTIM